MDDETCYAYVSAGHLLFFEAGVSPQLKEDIICSSLYSQSSASHQCSKYSEFTEWSAKCNEVMSLLGWVTLQEHTQDYVYGADVSLGVERTLTEMLGPKVSAVLLQQFLRLCAELKTSGNYTPEQRFLLEHTLDSLADVDSTTLTLLVSFVSPASIIITACLTSKMPTASGKLPVFAHLSTQRSNGRLSITVSSAEFVERRYRRIRERVITELGAAKNDGVIVLNKGQTA